MAHERGQSPISCRFAVFLLHLFGSCVQTTKAAAKAGRQVGRQAQTRRQTHGHRRTDGRTAKPIYADRDHASSHFYSSPEILLSR